MALSLPAHCSSFRKSPRHNAARVTTLVSGSRSPWRHSNGFGVVAGQTSVRCFAQSRSKMNDHSLF